jgi:hypothetical protein
MQKDKKTTYQATVAGLPPLKMVLVNVPEPGSLTSSQAQPAPKEQLVQRLIGHFETKGK